MSALADFRPGQLVTYQHKARWRRSQYRMERFAGRVVRVNRTLITVRLHVGNGRFIVRAVWPERLKIRR